MCDNGIRVPQAFAAAGQIMASKGEGVHYQHGSGTEEILRPTLVTVSGRCYRKLTETTFGKRKEVETLEYRGKKQLFTDDVYDEGEDTTLELEGVEQTPGGGYVLHLPIPSIFFKYIIGREGKTKSNIEKDTMCRLRIPGKGREGDIVLEGMTVASVADAKRRVEIVAWSSRLKEPPTHFISMPLNYPAIQDNFKDFRDIALAACQKDRGIQPAVFQEPAKLHITLGVMRLFNQEEEERAKEILKECIAKAVPHLGSDPVVLSLHGVECMKDDPSAVDVLYAKVCLTDGTNRLQVFVDTIVEHFLVRAPDLMTREHEREGIKLHATVMNSKFPYRDKDSTASGGHRGRPKVSFDARTVFQEMGDFYFGDIPLEIIHLSKRGEYGPDGYYKCIADYSIADFAPS